MVSANRRKCLPKFDWLTPEQVHFMAQTSIACNVVFPDKAIQKSNSLELRLPKTIGNARPGPVWWPKVMECFAIDKNLFLMFMFCSCEGWVICSTNCFGYSSSIHDLSTSTKVYNSTSGRNRKTSFVLQILSISTFILWLYVWKFPKPPISDAECRP